MSLKSKHVPERSEAHTHFCRKFSKYCQLLLENWLRWPGQPVFLATNWVITEQWLMANLFCRFSALLIHSPWRDSQTLLSRTIPGCHLHRSYFNNAIVSVWFLKCCPSGLGPQIDRHGTLVAVSSWKMLPLNNPIANICWILPHLSYFYLNRDEKNFIPSI